MFLRLIDLLVEGETNQNYVLKFLILWILTKFLQTKKQMKTLSVLYLQKVASLSESQCNFLTYGGLKIFSNTISTTYQHLNMKMCALD